MDLTETPDDLPSTDEAPPDFSVWESPDTVLKGGPIRERLLDVILQFREPTKVATIAERADCDTETAREYLEWFASMGIVREHSGRPVRYDRNESYLFWRRVEAVRQAYTEDQIVDELSEVLSAIEDFQGRFDATSPDAVSLVETSDGEPIDDVWEALSEWQTLEQRAKVLDAARQGDGTSSGRLGSLNA